MDDRLNEKLMEQMVIQGAPNFDVKKIKWIKNLCKVKGVNPKKLDSPCVIAKFMHCYFKILRDLTDVNPGDMVAIEC